MATTYENLVLEVSPDGTLVKAVGGGYTAIQAYLDNLGTMNWQVVTILNTSSGPTRIVLKRSSADV